MERREQVAADQDREQAAVDTLDRDLSAARQARDEALAEVEQARTERAGRRAGWPVSWTPSC